MSAMIPSTTLATLTTSIGWLGLCILACAWIHDAIKILRTGKNTIPLRFTLLYIIGCVLLTIYSVLIGDTIFIILNAMAAISAIFHAIVAVRTR